MGLGIVILTSPLLSMILDPGLQWKMQNWFPKTVH